MTTRAFFTIAGVVVLSLAATIYFFPRQDHLTGVQPEEVAAPEASGAGIDGAKLYAQNCTDCHGANGQGNYGPALTSLSTTSDESLKILIRNGIPESDMHPYGDQFSPEEIAALVKYLKAELLPKPAAEKKQAEIGPNPAKTQIELALVQVSGGDLIARATLKDDKGAPMVKKPVMFNQVSTLGGRLPLASAQTNEQGLAVYYYPIKAGESVRIEVTFEGERGLAASSAMDAASQPGGKEPESLTTGLLSPNPPPGLVVIIGVVVGGIWLMYGYVVSLLLQIASWKDNTSRLSQRR